MAIKRAATANARGQEGDSMRKRRVRNLKKTKKRRQADESETVGDEEEVDVSDSSGSDSAAGDPDQCFDEKGNPIPCKPKRHIHPCICDLTQKQKDRIAHFLQERQRNQLAYEKRVREIEEELERLEEERLAKERELQEQEELFGDEYEVVGKKKKRKKRSARRASMVSLGVKQVINWKKPPKIEVKYTAASNLRKEFTSYCGLTECPPDSPVPIDYRKEPNIPIRATNTFTLRSGVNIKLKEHLINSEDKRPRFVTPYYV